MCLYISKILDQRTGKVESSKLLELNMQTLMSPFKCFLYLEKCLRIKYRIISNFKKPS